MIEEEVVLSKKKKKSRRLSNDTIAERENEPLLPIGMASFFFDRSPPAMRFLEDNGYFVDLHQNPLNIHRTRGNERRFSLRDLRYIAHSFRRNNVINDRQLRLILKRLDAFREPLKAWTWYEGSEQTLTARDE